MIPKKHVDFILDDHGSVLFLRPQNDTARSWVEIRIRQEGYQPSWPDVLLERRYVLQVLQGAFNAGFTVAYGIAGSQAVT